jgi:gliding motility-associated-like protein
MFLPFVACTQQQVSFCDILTKEYTVVYEGDTFDIEIQPETFYQVENNKVYVTYSQVGTYLITATSYSGDCFKEDKLIVEVIECDSTLIWVPNAFTPNADTKNYEFGAYGINIKTFKMEIYDRWGELLFLSEDVNKRWDGINPYRNIPYPQDVYSYKILYQDIDNRFHQIFGRITLIH